MIRRWFAGTAPAGDCMAILKVQVGAPVKFTVKSLPTARGLPTVVVPSARYSCAVTLVGAASHMPPGVGFGSRSVTVTPQAVPVPALCTLSVKVPGTLGRIWVGPDLSNVSVSGPMTVMGGFVVTFAV